MKNKIEELEKGCGKIFDYERRGVYMTGACGDTGYTDGFIPLCPECKDKIEELKKEVGKDA